MRRAFLLTVIALSVLEVLSFLVFRHTTLSGIAMAVIVVAISVLSWNRPWLLVMAMVAELSVGGKGYLLSLHWHGEWPLRLGLFIMMILVVAVRAKAWKLQFPPRSALVWPAVLLLWVGWATAWGLIQNIPLKEVFYDMNAFLYLPVIGLWWMLMRRQGERMNSLLSVVAGGVTVTALLGLVLTVCFGSSWSQAPEVYSWIWFTKTGEISLIGDHTYRVFLQSQIIGLLLACVLILRPKVDWRRWMWVPLIAGSTSIWVSLSRSYWLGIGVGLLTMAVVLWHQRGLMITVLQRLAIATVAGFLLMNWAGNFPNPIPWLGQRHALSARITDIGGAQAASARWNQIRPLLNAIRFHPIVGRGFGTAVTFYSPDPRTQGYRSATAFELGYLDWWLDLGLIGLVLVFGWGIALARRSWRDPSRRLYLPSLVALFAIHATTLYLNFPVGIGWLGLLTIALYDHE